MVENYNSLFRFLEGGPGDPWVSFRCLHPDFIILGKHSDFEAPTAVLVTIDRVGQEDFKEKGTEIDFEVFGRVENIHFKIERGPQREE